LQNFWQALAPQSTSSTHGIAKHGGGFVAIETAPAKGTTVSVYLPPAPEAGELGKN
jgi:hypothetical protein